MMLKTIGAITVFTYAALLFSAPLLDPVILENEYLKLTVDRQPENIGAGHWRKTGLPVKDIPGKLPGCLIKARSGEPAVCRYWRLNVFQKMKNIRGSHLQKTII